MENIVSKLKQLPKETKDQLVSALLGFMGGVVLVQFILIVVWAATHEKMYMREVEKDGRIVRIYNAKLSREYHQKRREMERTGEGVEWIIDGKGIVGLGDRGLGRDNELPMPARKLMPRPVDSPQTGQTPPAQGSVARKR